MEQDLVSYLSSKGLQIRKANGSEIVVHCFFCNEEKKQPKLYLNTDSWLYDCKLCAETGNRKTLLRHFGDEDDADEVGYLPGQDPAKRRRVLKVAAEKAHQLLLQNETILAYLLERGLDPDTIVANKIGFVPPNLGFARSLDDGFTVADVIGAGLLTSDGVEFLNNSLTIPYLHHGSVVQLRAKDIDGRYRTAGNQNVRLYNEDALLGAERALICEGELDALMVQQALAASGDAVARTLAVVAIPGAGAFPERLDAFFSTMKRVYIGLDPDPPGQIGTAKLKELLDSKSRIVELPRGAEPKCDWTEYLRNKSESHPWGGHTWRDVLSLLADADLVGKRMFSVTEARHKWEQDQVERPGIKLGFPSLDSRIKPGLRSGQVMIPLAKTGTGKTVFLANVAHNTRHHRCLFLSMELTAVELFGMMRRIHFFHQPDGRIESMGEDYKWLRIVDENRVRQHEMATLVAEYTEDVGAPPELLIVDYLGYYARGSTGGSPYEKTSDAVMGLKGEAKAHDLAVIAPHQVSRKGKDGAPLEADDARDSGVVEETGDFVLSLFRPDQAIGSEDGITGAFNLQLLKSRHGGKGHSANLRFSNLSLAIVDSLDRRNVNRIDQENTLYQQGMDYEEYRKQQQSTQLRVVG
jgi:hypothetical protein